MRVAIVGASGFVGTRLIEMSVLGGLFDAVPVVRSFGSLAVMARFALPWKVCDTMDPEALARAFEGCDHVIHAAIGNPVQIPQMAGAIYRGAELAGIKRLVVLSSASVHGQSPPAQTDELSPLHESHPLPYNNAKVRAEKVLRQLADTGSVQLVLLRPSIVFGPRSRWITDCASQMLRGNAALIGDGSAVCNTIYVDNLIHAICLALESPEAAGQTFLLRDAETVTWREFYSCVAEAVGSNMDSVRQIAPPVYTRSMKEKVGEWVATPALQAILPVFPRAAKDVAKRLLASLNLQPQINAWSLPQPPPPAMTEELSLLQQSCWQIPLDRARQILGYEPLVPFAEGMRRSMEWLGFTGFPIREINFTSSIPLPTTVCRS
jgi:nucleoside-diphosphate-sugar epimerase